MLFEDAVGEYSVVTEPMVGAADDKCVPGVAPLVLGLTASVLGTTEAAMACVVESIGMMVVPTGVLLRYTCGENVTLELGVLSGFTDVAMCDVDVLCEGEMLKIVCGVWADETGDETDKTLWVVAVQTRKCSQ